MSKFLAPAMVAGLLLASSGVALALGNGGGHGDGHASVGMGSAAGGASGAMSSADRADHAERSVDRNATTHRETGDQSETDPYFYYGPFGRRW